MVNYRVESTAANNEKRDARILYIMVLASPRTHYSPQGVRGDSFLVDVRRNWFALRGSAGGIINETLE